MCNILRIMIAVAASGAIAVTSGCLAVAAGAAAGGGTFAYMQGEMSTTFEAPIEKVWEATHRAVESLEFTIESDARDALQGRVNVRQADNTRIRISLERQTDDLTDVRVRVGIFGDEAKSRLILDRIRSNL